jgi:predicted N-acyltransferase
VTLSRNEKAVLLVTSDLSTQLRVVPYRSIHEVEETLWNSINSDQDVFHNHSFIRTVEDAGVENSQFWYLLFFCGDELVATGALSAFTVSLDLFVGGGAANFIQSLRRWWPRLMKIKVLFCGLPISLGQHNLVIRDRSQANGVLALLVKEMSEICQTQDIRYMCVKELQEGHIETIKGIEKHGFFLANSIPYVYMKMSWPNFESYLATLRHGYRRPIKLALKKLGQTRPEIVSLDRTSREPNHPKLVLGADVCSPEKFYELYLQVMDRAEVKLETLNQAFFDNLYTNMKEDWDLLALVKGEEVLGAALLSTSNKIMTFVLVGLDYAKRDEYDVYFNLVYGIIDLAIQRGCRELNLGQTSYWLKQRIGGICIPEYLYFKARSRPVHFCISSLRMVLFPAVKLPRPRVFRA